MLQIQRHTMEHFVLFSLLTANPSPDGGSDLSRRILPQEFRRVSRACLGATAVSDAPHLAPRAPVS